VWIGDDAMASALIQGAKEPQWTQDSAGKRMPYQKLGGADCSGCDGQCTGTCGKAPIGGQIDPSGFLAQESNRVNSVGYTTGELQNLFRLAQISRSVHTLLGEAARDRRQGEAGEYSDERDRRRRETGEYSDADAGDNDLFLYTSKSGGSIRRALDYLVPYLPQS
jgi:hypothetical protein